LQEDETAAISKEVPTEIPIQPADTQHVANEGAEPGNSSEHTNQSENSARTEEKVVVKKEVKTFTQKIKENWHKLSERVKNLFLSFGERIKKVVGIK
jgi:hypothetical protein